MPRKYTHKIWTQEELQFVRENLDWLTAPEMARHLNRPIYSIRNKLRIIKAKNIKKKNI